MQLQAIFIFCLIILILIIFHDLILQALVYFKSIEAGTQGIKLIMNPDEIKKAIDKSKFPKKVKVELSKPQNIEAIQYFFYDIYRSINPREKSLDEILNIVKESSKKEFPEK